MMIIIMACLRYTIVNTLPQDDDYDDDDDNDDNNGLFEVHNCKYPASRW
jgi:hypothetical protein